MHREIDRHRLGATLFLVAASASFVLSITRVVHRQSPGRRFRRPLGAINPRRRSVLDGRDGTGPLMSLDVVIGLAGVIVTVLVVAGMILITPRGVDPSHLPAEPRDSNDVVASTATATQPALH
jgi:hypothetical protein